MNVAHLAGVLDALARIRIRTTDAGTRLAVVAVSSPDLGILRYLAEATGVKVVRVRRSYDRLGCNEHCDKRHLHVHSDTGRWELVGARAVVVLRAVRPHLIRLGPEADDVLAECGDAPVKSATLRRMRELGWEVAA